MQFTLSLVVFCSLIFSGGQKWERINYIWEMEASDGLDLFGNDGSGAVFQLTNEFSDIGDRSEKSDSIRHIQYGIQYGILLLAGR